MHCPTDTQWQALKRILRYIQSTPTHGLRYTKQPSIALNAFSDSDWAGDPDDRRSVTGFAIFHSTNLSWAARKQKTVSRSSTEAEYRALVATTSELAWLGMLLVDIYFPLATTLILWCDNLSATYLTENPIFHTQTKHLELDFHFVRERVSNKQLIVHYISTDDHIADIFTKPLSHTRFSTLRNKLAVVSTPPQLAGG